MLGVMWGPNEQQNDQRLWLLQAGQAWNYTTNTSLHTFLHTRGIRTCSVIKADRSQQKGNSYKQKAYHTEWAKWQLHCILHQMVLNVESLHCEKNAFLPSSGCNDSYQKHTTIHLQIWQKSLPWTLNWALHHDREVLLLFPHGLSWLLCVTVCIHSTRQAQAVTH